jgi:hypothetical protein
MYCCSDVLRKVISQQVAATMVLPNKLPIVLSNEIATHIVKLPEPEVSFKCNISYFINP